MQKTDLLKQFKAAYTATANPQIIEVGEGTYISLAGEGDPNGPLFADCMQTIYTAAYSIKMDAKAAGKDFVVSKPEGLWWLSEEVKIADGNHLGALEVSRDGWRWQLIMRIPAYISLADFQNAITNAIRKKKLPLLGKVELITLNEGKCIQIMHTGPYATEIETLKKMMAFSDSHNFQQNGRHHEIYLSDARRTAPEKMKTILRQPVK